MSSMNIIDLSSDDELGEVEFKTAKVEPDLIKSCMKQKKQSKSDTIHFQKSKPNRMRQGSDENGSSSALSTGQSSTSVLDQEPSLVDDANLCSTSSIGAAPLCRQFWKAGNYDNEFNSKSTIQNGTSYLRIHPKFLHSNATSHQWAFGAVAELLDNAVDEIQNGATFVVVDNTSNPRDGSPALLIQDDGGGMDPDTIRHCLSFGFSDKKSKSAIGKYGNGFKTSTMRLGADVIVFSRHMKNRKLTQSIGLISYTFLTQTGQDRIVVPMVDYEFDTATGALKTLHRFDKEHFVYNLSMLLRWSPYSTEMELVKQFDDIGYHGTKIIIYNLWLNDEGTMELDFESDPEDIHIFGEAKNLAKINPQMAVNEQHIANRFRYSLRAYLSVLYLRIPESFCILLRGRVIEYHSIACDLKFPEFILYKPQGCRGAEVITTIGFLKEAPLVNIHGFNVYHKNHLILPFWRVVNYTNSRGRGVVGVLEANFMEPTHNKQDFEKTSVFQKLEVRLKEMTWEYWDYHCGLIGYQVQKKSPTLPQSQVSPGQTTEHGVHQPVVLSRISTTVGSVQVAWAGGGHQHGRTEKLIADPQSNSKQDLKRKEFGELVDTEKVKKKAGSEAMLMGSGHNKEAQLGTAVNQLEDPETRNLMLEHQKLRAQCLEHKKREEELNLKVTRLRSELAEVQREYARLMAEAQWFERVKEENNVNI